MTRTQIEVPSCYTKKIIAVCVLSIFLFSGCATTSNISPQTQLGDDEGIMLANVHSNIRGIELIFYNDNSLGFSPDVKLSDDDHFNVVMIGKLASSSDQPIDYMRIVPVKSGKMRFSIVKRLNKSTLLEPYRFNILAGHITYIGDIYINWTDTSGFSGYVTMRIVDNEAETVSKAKNEFAWLFDKFKYIKDIPNVKIETVEGFKEAKELKDMKENLKNEKNSQQ